MKILIADDEPITRNVLRFQLEGWGHTVVEAENGLWAWELLQTLDCHLVITDWNMPEMTGIELIRKIRKSDRPGYLYVILLTSNTERASLLTGLNTGADDYLAKPVHQDELKARLQPVQRIIDLEYGLAERNQQLNNNNLQLTAANSKMKRDLDAAAQIQQAFLPDRTQGVTGVEFAWDYSPCTELAGDMLNVQALDDDHVGIYMLDVSGHGVQAALMAVSACRYLSNHRDASSVLWERPDGSLQYHLRSPAAATEQLNARFIAQSLSEQYFTLTYGILSQLTGEFRYTVAGHPPPIHVTANGDAAFLRGNGLPIGITETDYDEYSAQLEPGDRLVFYSDGVTECMNERDELFGNARLLHSLFGTIDGTLDATLAAVRAHIQEWTGPTGFHDDVTILVLEYQPQQQQCVVPRYPTLSLIGVD